MKKILIMMMAALLAAGVASAADVTVGVDVASAYVFRGTTFNDGLVVQPYAEIAGFPIPEEYGSLTVGAWGNVDIGDYGGTLDDNELSEVDYYLSYGLPIKALDVSVGYTEYSYPNGGSADREVGLSLGKSFEKSGLSPYFNAYYGVDGAIEDTWYVQGGVGYEIAVSEELSLSADVAVGYVTGSGTDGFNDVTSSLGASYALTSELSLSASITHILELDVLDADTELYGMLGVSYTF